MARFRCKDDDELKGLDDEALLVYIAAARRAGEPDCAKRGLAIIVMRYEGDVKRRVAGKLPRADVEDVAQEAIVSAIFSSLEGHSIGEFRKWLNQIVSRRIADYYKRKRIETTELPEEHEENDEIWGQAGRVEDETGAVEVREAVEIVLAKLSDRHRRVVDLFVFERYSAQETADQVNDEYPDLNPPMSVDNVSQIAKRFRDDLRDLLSESDNPG